MILASLSYGCGNFIDTIATLHLYAQGHEELNPISAILLQSPPLFATFKLTTMTIAVMFCWWKRDWNLCKVASWILFIEYLLVAWYYVCALIWAWSYTL